MSTFTPAVTLHVAAALAALVLGPLALWARRRGGGGALAVEAHAAVIAVLAPHRHPVALIAEDEPLLAQALAGELARAWPELTLVATVGDGASAVEKALALQPDVLFFDIRMPGLGGLEAAAELADRWPADGPPFPALVFVTAYDQYAVQAFETHAVDYVLKPVRPERLARTVGRLQALLARRGALDSPPPLRPDRRRRFWPSCVHCWPEDLTRARAQQRQHRWSARPSRCA